MKITVPQYNDIRCSECGQHDDSVRCIRLGDEACLFYLCARCRHRLVGILEASTPIVRQEISSEM